MPHPYLEFFPICSSIKHYRGMGMPKNVETIIGQIKISQTLFKCHSFIPVTVGLQITFPLIPSCLFALFHIKVLLTNISEFLKSKLLIVKASNSLIRSTEQNKVSQIILNLLFRLLSSRTLRKFSHLLKLSSVKT